MCRDPDSLTTLPESATDLPQSRILYSYSDLYTDGKETGQCPLLYVTPGDTYGVSWQSDTVTFYHNGDVHYVWKVDIPDTTHVWGVVGMRWLDQISVIQTGK